MLFDELGHQVCNNPVEFPPTPEVSSDAKSLILALLNKDHAQRLSLVGIREHSFMLSEQKGEVRPATPDAAEKEPKPWDVATAIIEGCNIDFADGQTGLADATSLCVNSITMAPRYGRPSPDADSISDSRIEEDLPPSRGSSGNLPPHYRKHTLPTPTLQDEGRIKLIPAAEGRVSLRAPYTTPKVRGLSNSSLMLSNTDGKQPAVFSGRWRYGSVLPRRPVPPCSPLLEIERLMSNYSSEYNTSGTQPPPRKD